MKTALKLIKLATRFMHNFAGVAFGLALTFNFANVIGRYVFQSPIYWAEELIIFLMIATVFLTSPAVALNNDHLRVEAVELFLPPRLRTLHGHVLTAIGACIVVYVALQSYKVIAMLSANDQRSTVAELPMNIPFAAILLGLILIAICMAARIVSSVREANAAAKPRPAI